MKTVMSTKYVVKGFNGKALGSIPKGWVLESRDTTKPETLIVNEFKYVDDGTVIFYLNDGTVQYPMMEREHNRKTGYKR